MNAAVFSDGIYSESNYLHRLIAMRQFYINGVKVTSCNIESSTQIILDWVKNRVNSFICVTDSGNVVKAVRESPALKDAINNSGMSLPDGRPLSILGKIKGFTEMDRVAGPDIMSAIFKATQNSEISHFFLGDTSEVHIRLHKKLVFDYSHLRIAGMYSPPFGEWNKKIQDVIIQEINSKNPNIVWVGLGGGKQEIWMHNNYARLPGCVVIGVGAAFRFYIGDIKRAPKIFQYLSLEWLFRLLQQPRKMFFRYVSTLPFFMVYFIIEMMKLNKGKQ